MTILDSLVGLVSPMARLRRMQARAAVEIYRENTASRSYDGATSPRRGLWRSVAQSPNAVLGSALAPLRERARDLVRNTPMARVPDVLAAYVVGTGIVPVSRCGNRALDKTVNKLFENWAQTCLIGGDMDFYGLQALMMRAVVEGGEALLRFLPRASSPRLAVPLQLRAMEGDHIDDSRNGLQARRAGHTTTLGIEFNAQGERTGYWLRKADAKDPRGFCALESVYVPAGDIVHLYRTLRIGQVRGATWFAPIMNTARDRADYLEASLIKARTEACFAGFITSPDQQMPGNLGAARRAEDGRSAKKGELELSPGMMSRLEPGEEVMFAQPSSSNSFEPYMLHAHMSIAAGLGITYDQLTGDLRQANYSSLRAGKIEFRALVRQFQHHMMIPMLCRPVWRRFIEMAILDGKLPPRARGYPAAWIAPGFEPIDPLKDLKADILAVRSGRMTLGEYMAEWGNDPQTQLEEIQTFNKELDALGITLDVDPRKVAASGIAQAIQQQAMPQQATQQEDSNSAQSD